MANEKRLIDANALKPMFDRREADDVEFFGGVYIPECFPADDAKEIVDQMPTVDAVEVVRCKDCKHYKPQFQGAHRNCTTPYCMRVNTVKVKPDDFCSFGERRE